MAHSPCYCPPGLHAHMATMYHWLAFARMWYAIGAYRRGYLPCHGAAMPVRVRRAKRKRYPNVPATMWAMQGGY
jgi:hypothetical protein